MKWVTNEVFLSYLPKQVVQNINSREEEEEEGENKLLKE